MVRLELREQTPEESATLALPSEVLAKTGWRPGDAIVMHTVHGGTMLVMRSWNRRPGEEVVE